MAYLREPSLERRVRTLCCSSQACELRSLSIVRNPEADGGPSKADRLLQLQLRAGDLARADRYLYGGLGEAGVPAFEEVIHRQLKANYRGAMDEYVERIVVGSGKGDLMGLI